MNDRKKRRYNNRRKAWALIRNRISPELIRSQEQAMESIDSVIAAEIERHYEEFQDSDCASLSYNHIHVCAYKLMRPNDKPWQRSQCKKWCDQHVSVPVNTKFSLDPCDVCTKMTIVAFSEEGDVMYASRTSPELVQSLIERVKYFTKLMPDSTLEGD